MSKFFILLMSSFLLFSLGCTNIKNQSIENIYHTSKNESLNIEETETAKTQSSSNTFSTSSQNQISKSNTNLMINELSDTKNGIYLGMTRDDLLTTLKGMNIHTWEETQSKTIANNKNSRNKLLMIENASFEFDSNYKLQKAYITNISTKLGLKINDTLETMEKIYGKNYTYFLKDNTDAYEYNMDNHIFIVYVKGNKVVSWEINNYSSSIRNLILEESDSKKDKPSKSDHPKVMHLSEDDFAISDGTSSIKLYMDITEFENLKIDEKQAKSNNNYVGEKQNGDFYYKYFCRVYESFDLYISNVNYNVKGKDFDSRHISQITLNKSKFQTSRGITIGSSVDDVINAYGSNYTKDGYCLKYNFNDMELSFEFDLDYAITKITLHVTIKK